MKINVERGAFLKALNHVQSVVERRNTIPILSNVMIEAAKGALKLTATDLDIEIVECHARRHAAQRLRHRARPYALRHCAQAAGRRPGAGRTAVQRRRPAGGVGRLLAL